jgi:hypothetical protein
MSSINKSVRPTGKGIKKAFSLKLNPRHKNGRWFKIVLSSGFKKTEVYDSAYNES